MGVCNDLDINLFSKVLNEIHSIRHKNSGLVVYCNTYDRINNSMLFYLGDCLEEK